MNKDKKKLIESRYNNIDVNYGSEGRNMYTCKVCSKNTLTRHKHKGVTPMFIPCKCGEVMVSAGYRIPQKGAIRKKTGHLIFPNNRELWIRPSLDDVFLMIKNGHDLTVEHILNGGLIFESELKIKTNELQP